MKNRGIQLLICVILFWSCAISCTKKETRRILIIHSYEESYAGYPQFNHLIAKEFQKKKINADLCILYLDCESYQEKAELDRMRRMLDSVTAWKPEAIIVNDDQATYSLLKCDHPLAKRVPIVFSGVNYPNWDLIKQYTNVTGFHDKIDFIPNIEMAKSILGEDTNFYILLDSTFLDRKIRADLSEQFKNKKIVYSNRLKRQEYIQYKQRGYTFFTTISVRNNSDRTGDGGLIWSLSKYEKGRCYLQAKRDFTTVNISNIAYSPSFTTINEAFGFGEKLLGGYFTPLSTQVEEEVAATVQILRGKKPSDISIKESGKKYLIDWEIMKLRGIPLNKIPSQYTIINMPFHIKYRALWIVMLASSCLLIVSIITWLVFLYRREQKRKKKALHALADEKETLALAIEGSDTYAWKYEDGKFIFETAFWQAQGVKKQIPTIEELELFIHSEHHDLFWKNWMKLPEAQKEISQMRCDFNGKGYQWWEFRYTTTRLESGGYRTAGLLLNIETFKKRELELEEARKLAEKAELKESFLANMSHEIRTPLNAIVGFSTLLASEEVEMNERQDYVEAISRNNELLLKLINDILELSRLKSGYMSFTFEKCHVNNIIDGIYSTYQLIIPPQLQFIKETDGKATIEIDVDKNRFIQVITNFLNNACKFTKEGSIKIGYDYLQEKSEVAVYVEDTGQGIAPAEKEIIFNRFYKHDEFAQGAGLGLSICQSIIEKLNGRIELWSEQGKGSRFTIILPGKIVF